MMLPLLAKFGLKPKLCRLNYSWYPPLEWKSFPVHSHWVAVGDDFPLCCGGQATRTK